MDLKSKNVELDNETYEKIIEDCCNKVNGLNDDDWQDIVDRYGLEVSNDHLRKNFTGIFGSAFVKKYYDEKRIKDSCNNDYITELEDKIREFERAKIKYRDQRNAWNKQNYSNARVEETLDLLEKELKSIGRIEFSILQNENRTINDKYSEDEMIICLSDLHIGQTFDSLFGKYNSNIAKYRLEQYLKRIIKIGDIHGINKVHVVGLGDLISGSIHKSIQITNKENVVEQIKTAIIMISSFCSELCNNFSEVYYYDVVGNHSRIDKKDDALHDERLDDLIGWSVGVILGHKENFHMMNHRKLDVGIADINVCGKTYLAVHGDYDPMTKSGISNLSMMSGIIPYAVLRGHMHYPAHMEISGVQVVQSGSLAGCGDQYTIEKRLNGKPSQTVLICNKDGIECVYNVKLY